MSTEQKKTGQEKTGGNKNKILFILTSQRQLGDTGEETGFHFSEMAEPYYILQEHGVEVTLASIKGGTAPIDPGSLKDDDPARQEIIDRFQDDPQAMDKLKNTAPVADIDIAGFDGLYLPGGHGTMWDFPDNKALQALLTKAWEQEKVIGAVCHGPAAFVNAKDSNGEPLIKNRRLNSFTNEEETEVEKDNVVPFLLESRLREQGALFDKEQPFQAFVVEDSHLLTGQNPASAPLVANAILRCLGISPYHKDEAAA